MMFARRDAAVRAVSERRAPRVLDVGSGSGRVGELMLEAGAGRYLGIDFSEPMTELARARLARFRDRAELRTANFLEADLGDRFDVVVALGLFDYIEDPVPFARRMAELCADVTIASFPRWDWVKGPIRRAKYRVVNDCPIFDYTPRELDFLFRSAGFARVAQEVRRTGILLHAFAH
ncbi:MAG TPA: class I SAM-dependent methyltransferase [Polyangiaceae bacterium]|nr:class I SAM-dependent methyltransferase [Polyangiaceae bacterium]